MRRYSYETRTDLPPERLYNALSDIESWPEWDDGIEAIAIDGPAERGVEFALKPRGVEFALKPRGRQAVKLRVETPPTFLCHRPGGSA